MSQQTAGDASPAAATPKIGEVRSRLQAGHRLRTMALGLAELLGAGLLWAATLVGVILAPWWAKPLLGLANGFFIAILFLSGHDAAHGSLLPRRRLNRLAAKLALLPALHPLAGWVHSHNVMHHSFTNLKEKDPGFPPLSLAEYQGLPAWRRWLHRRCRSAFGLGLYHAIELWWKWEMAPAAERRPRDPRGYRRDRLQTIAFAAAWAGGLLAAGAAQGEGLLGAFGLAGLGFLLPFAVWNWLIGFIIFQQHTHPAIPWRSLAVPPAATFFESQVLATPHLVFPGPMRFLMRHIMEHTAHHADPAVPLYRLNAAQKTLKRAYREEIIKVPWTVRGFFRLFRICRLYDYSAHRWLDYDGSPMTEPLLPAAAAASPDTPAERQAA